jgi:HEAT repeat protein
MASEDDFQRRLALLETTEDDQVRNTLAMDLAETRRQEALAPLVRLIGREDLRNKRGTLVHALSYLDCSGHVSLLAELVATGNFEVAHEAFHILDDMEAPASDDIDRAVEITEQALAAPPVDNWRRDLLEDLMTFYGD